MYNNVLIESSTRIMETYIHTYIHAQVYTHTDPQPNRSPHTVGGHESIICPKRALQNRKIQVKKQIQADSLHCVAFFIGYPDAG